MNALLEKMKKSSTIKRSDILSDSDILRDKDSIQTEVPFMNVALGGDFGGGVRAGVTMLAGPSKHFKTLFALVMASAFQKKYKDGIVLFYDSEFGTPPAYFNTLNMDTSRIFHTPITDIEELKSDIMNQLKEFKKSDKVFVVIDSVGNLASKKEIDDALDGKTVTDMTRAKAMKSLFRMITPHLTLKDIPLVAINHTYKEMCLDGSVLIRSDKGNVPIKDIKVGDKVYALTGLHDVTAVYGPDQLDATHKKFLEIEFDDGSFIKCTHDHKFLVEDRSWREAIDLKIGQVMY